MLSKLIEVSELVYTYRVGSANEVRALKKIDLDVYKGEFLTITGQNGSGKSTLARHFNGLLILKSGKVLVGGLSTALNQHIPTIRKTVGMVFQNPDNQLISSIVEEDIAFGPENLGLPAPLIRERVDWALDTLGITALRKKAPQDLSEGQKQLVAIAGVLAMKPACIVFDEPTAHLDPRSQREVMENIRRLNEEENITIILLTHFMDEAIYSERMCVMDEGKIALSGPPQQLFSHPDGLNRLGLGLPVATRLARALRSQGLNLPEQIIFAEELVDKLCQLK